RRGNRESCLERQGLIEIPIEHDRDVSVEGDAHCVGRGIEDLDRDVSLPARREQASRHVARSPLEIEGRAFTSPAGDRGKGDAVSTDDRERADGFVAARGERASGSAASAAAIRLGGNGRAQERDDERRPTCDSECPTTPGESPEHACVPYAVLN